MIGHAMEAACIHNMRTMKSKGHNAACKAMREVAQPARSPGRSRSSKADLFEDEITFSARANVLRQLAGRCSCVQEPNAVRG